MISIVIPCYNSEKTLKRTVDSVLRQTHREIEVILVDDGSTDATGRICDEFSKIDYRVHVIHQDNKGLVSSWKTGVKQATGEYIIFSDSDDYIENSLVRTVDRIIKEFKPDIILYGMDMDYNNSSTIHLDNGITQGFYNKERIINEIYPILFADEGLESWGILPSRCCKAFSRRIMRNILDDIPDDITNGEDNLTSFVMALNSESIYCIKGYYPYHYVRNDDSMIGKYDPRWYEKLKRLNGELLRVADKYAYSFTDQIRKDFFSNVIIYCKKEICRNPYGYKKIRKQLIYVCDDIEFKSLINLIDLNSMTFMQKIFTILLIKRMYFLLYCSTKFINWAIKGKP